MKNNESFLVYLWYLGSMKFSNSIKELTYLSLPMILGQIGQMLIGAGDVYMATLYSTQTVASIGVANGVINPIFLFGIGLMMGVSPSLAKNRGEGSDSRDSLSSILVYATFVGLVICGITLSTTLVIPYMGFDPLMVPSMTSYINVVAWSLPFAIIFQAIKEYLQAYEEVMFVNIVSIIAVVLNLIINYYFIFGYGDFKGFGEIGLAYASLLIRILLFVVVIILVLYKETFQTVSIQFIKNVFKFSLPIAFMFFIEVLAFCTVTMLSGKLGVLEAAANNIVMTIASVAFMVPLSVSSAVAIKVGHAYGKQDRDLVIAFVKSAVFMILIYVAFSASLFAIFPRELLEFTSSDVALIDLGVKILYVVAVFQIVDSLQVIFSGILRGLNNTTVSSLLVFIGYWVIGLPIGIYMAFYDDKGAYGLWIGLAISLGMTALFLFIFLQRMLRKDVIFSKITKSFAGRG